MAATETIAIVTGGAASGSPLNCVKNLDRAGIDAVPADCFRERTNDGAAPSLLFVRGAKRARQQLLRAQRHWAPRLRMRAGGKIEHRGA